MISLFRRRSLVSDLKTARLRLVAMTPAMLEADAAQDGSLASALGADLTPEWPPVEWEPHVIDTISRQIHETPSLTGWNRYVLLREGGRTTLIGCVGGFPKAEGVVEIGYSTLPAFQRRGFASEAANALVDWLLQQATVRAVTAQTFTTIPESIKVMKHCGLMPAGQGDDPGTVRYCRDR